MALLRGRVALALLVLATWPRAPVSEARLVVKSGAIRRAQGLRVGLLPWGNKKATAEGATRDFVAITEQHNEALLLKHGFIQRKGRADGAKSVVPLTLALNKETGELAVVPAEDVAPTAKHVKLCLLPEGLRKKPLQAIAICHALIYALDLLDYLATTAREEAEPGRTQEVVIVGFTALSRCLIPIIAEMGFEVTVVVPSPGDAAPAKALGASHTLLRDADPPFSRMMPDAVAYVDAIGRQSSGALSPSMRPRYFAVTPLQISEAISAGALKGISMGLGLGFLRPSPEDNKKSAEAAGVWTPAPEAQERVGHAVGVMGDCAIEQLRKRISNVLPEIASWKDYGQALTWPRDPESGVHYGFDASVSELLRNSDSWGVQDLSKDPTPPVPRELGPSVKDVAAGMLNSASALNDGPGAVEAEADAASTSLASADPKLVDGVYVVATIEEAMGIIRRTRAPSVLLVGGKWCRACKYASGQVRRVAERFPEVRFFEYRASSKGEPLRSTLGVSAVPTMLLNRNGQTIHQSMKCSDSSLIAADVESWLL